VTQSKGLSIFLIIDKAKLKVVSTWIELLRRIRNTLFRRRWETLHHTSSWLNTDGEWMPQSWFNSWEGLNSIFCLGNKKYI